MESFNLFHFPLLIMFILLVHDERFNNFHVISILIYDWFDLHKVGSGTTSAQKFQTVIGNECNFGTKIHCNIVLASIFIDTSYVSISPPSKALVAMYVANTWKLHILKYFS